MKTIFKFTVTLVMLAVVLLWQSCCNSTDLKFSGKVVDKTGKGIAEAVVKVGEKEEKTNRNGEFEIAVAKSNRYVLNFSKLNYGFASKIYQDTASRLIVTLVKSTVVTTSSNKDISIQDIRPDMSLPGGPLTVTNPLDTIPFVYDDKGRLTGFTKPKEASVAEDAIENYRPPVLGAKIQIKAGTLVFEGSTRKPDGDIQISLNTVDTYSPDGMPGDYSVDLGKNTEAYMIPFGAANIEAYANGEPLQLAPDAKAILTIPVDTLLILGKETLPDEIPLLVYNRTTGFWNVDGKAKLNAEKTAYTTEIGHFSTYNMDLFKTTPSCIQLCRKAPGGTSLRITVGTRVKTLPNAAPNCSGTTDCNVYSVTGVETHGVINIFNNTGTKVEVMNGATPLSTYWINTGPYPGGTPSTYQTCGFNSCAGPFYITDATCWENSSGGVVNGMNKPVMTFRDAFPNITFSWIFIESIAAATGVITNSTNFYEIEYQTYSNVESFNGLKTWTKVDFDPSGSSRTYHPVGGDTNWKFENVNVLFNESTVVNTNLDLDFAGQIILFRVNVYVGGNAPDTGSGVSPVINGTVTVHNLASATDSNFQTDLTTAYPCNIILP